MPCDPFKITAEEHEWMEKFFRYLMLHEGGIFTLSGSKPLISCYIFSYDQSERQRRKNQKNHRIFFLLDRSDKEDMEFYQGLSQSEKEEKAHLISHADFIYDFEDLWNRWEKIQYRLPLKSRFLLIKKQIPTDEWKQSDPECRAIYQIIFADVFKTALVIQKNYEIFKNAIGHDFDPLAVVLDLGKNDSSFWTQIKMSPSHSYLWGLLYGFGIENSFFYLWKWRHLMNKNSSEKEIGFAQSLAKYNSCADLYPSPSDKNAFTITNFPIPSFAVFSEDDPMVEKYKREREKIKKLYKDKDFVMLTLELLVENRT